MWLAIVPKTFENEVFYAFTLFFPAEYLFGQIIHFKLFIGLHIIFFHHEIKLIPVSRCDWLNWFVACSLFICSLLILTCWIFRFFGLGMILFSTCWKFNNLLIFSSFGPYFGNWCCPFPLLISLPVNFWIVFFLCAISFISSRPFSPLRNPNWFSLRFMRCINFQFLC